MLPGVSLSIAIDVHLKYAWLFLFGFVLIMTGEKLRKTTSKRYQIKVGASPGCSVNVCILFPTSHCLEVVREVIHIAVGAVNV